MSGKVRLVVAVFVAVAVGASGVPIAAQQQAAGAAAAGQGARAGLFASIQGTAVNWTNSAMANTPIRLRSARLGGVLDSVRTDRFGAFEFHNLEPGSYVAEMMNSTNDAVLAATPIVNVDSGQSVSVLIKLSLRTTTPAAAVFGLSAVAAAAAASTALAITSAAATAGVQATTAAGAPATDRALPGQR